MSDRARDIEDFHRTAVTANEVVVMVLLAEAIMRCPAVETDAADDAAFLKSLDEAIHRRGVGVDFEVRTPGDILERERTRGLREDSETGLQSSGPSHSRVSTLFQQTLGCILIRHRVESV